MLSRKQTEEDYGNFFFRDNSNIDEYVPTGKQMIRDDKNLIVPQFNPSLNKNYFIKNGKLYKNNTKQMLDEYYEENNFGEYEDDEEEEEEEEEEDEEKDETKNKINLANITKEDYIQYLQSKVDTLKENPQINNGKLSGLWVAGTFIGSAIAGYFLKQKYDEWNIEKAIINSPDLLKIKNSNLTNEVLTKTKELGNLKNINEKIAKFVTKNPQLREMLDLDI
jgi:hypothetical protein